MLNKFITVLIIEITNFLNENKDFFNLESTKRDEKLNTIKIPKYIKEYLKNTKFEDFTTELNNVVKFITKNEISNLNTNQFAAAIAKFLGENFVNDIYSLPLDFFKLNYNEQIEASSKIIDSQSSLALALKHILTDYSYQEILNGIQNFLNISLGSPLTLVQSPIELNLEQKLEIKTQLTKENQTLCVPIFQVNKNIIGGLRIFVNGKVSDFSWLGKINLITSLKI